MSSSAQTPSRPTSPSPDTPPAEFWEARYSAADRVWSGKVNRVLADTAVALAPGTALDLGCGEGGDAVWLASRGWRVTGVDLSRTAIERGRAAGRARGIAEAALTLEAADLAEWSSTERFDLVSSSFLHAWPIHLPRELILRRAVTFVAPGGHLLITSHAAAPPWADPEHASAHVFPTPEGDLEALELDLTHWEVLACETREREAFGPDGTAALLLDGVVHVRRVQ